MRLIFLLIVTVSLGVSKELGLDDLIKKVLERNPNIHYNNIQKSILKEKIRYEDAILVPTFFTELSYQRTKIPNDVKSSLSMGYQSEYFEKSKSVRMGFGGKLLTGAQWSVMLQGSVKNSNLIEASKNYDSEYSNLLSFKLTQPLLQGYGPLITKQNYYLALAQKDIFNEEYKKRALDLIYTTIEAYWNYYKNLFLYKSWQKSIRVNSNLLKLLKQREARGDLGYDQVLELESSLMEKRAEMKKAYAALVESKNKILSLLDLDIKDYDNLKIKTPMIEEEEFNEEIDANEYYYRALKYWPKLKTAYENLKKSELELKIAQDKKKPELDLLLSLDSNTLDSKKSRKLYNKDYLSWNIGLQLKIPLSKQQAKSGINMAKLKLSQSKIEVEALKRGLYNAIVTKIAFLKSARERVRLYKRGLELKKRLYYYIKKSFQLGEKSINDLLLKEDDVIKYRQKMLSALVEWKVSEALLDKATGILFQKYLKGVR